MFDVVVRNGTVVTATRTELRDVATRGTTIAAIERHGTFDGQAKHVIDASGCLVIPGGVDPHCHYNLDNWGKFRTEGQEHSAAAAFGGTTTILDFATHKAPESVADAIAAKRAEADGRMAVDYGLHLILRGNPSPATIGQIGDAVRAGVPSVKTFTCYEDECDDGHRFAVMQEVARTGGMSMIHAEDASLINWFTDAYRAAGKTQGAYVSETRNALVEEAAIRRTMLLAERSGSALYVVHMAAASGVNALAEGRARGLPFYGETLTPYLSFTADDLWIEDPVVIDGHEYGPRGLLYNNFPTPKADTDRETLWTALADGRLQTVGSDHAAITVANRYEKQGTTIESMQAGQAGVELRVPVTFHLGVNGGRITPNQFVEVVSTNAAKLMGLYPKKGELAVGSDADIVVIDPNLKWTVRLEDLHMSVDYNCWDGWELQGGVCATTLRGQVLIENREWVGPKTAGEFVHRTIDRSVLSHVIGG